MALPLSVTDSPIDKCKLLCDRTPKCIGFMTDNKKCWLKDSSVKIPAYTPNANFYYTGEAPSVAGIEPRVYHTMVMTDYPGQGDLQTLTGNLPQFQR
jgi:hypothetical protein